jgi:type IV secretory pathway protease TraF
MAENLLDLLAAMPKVEICIEGRRYLVPHGQPLLRGFQYLELTEVPITVTSGPFCWNGDCQSCLCDVEIDGRILPQTYACRHVVDQPLRVIHLNENYDFEPEP